MTMGQPLTHFGSMKRERFNHVGYESQEYGWIERYSIGDSSLGHYVSEVWNYHDSQQYLPHHKEDYWLLTDEDGDTREVTAHNAKMLVAIAGVTLATTDE